MDTKICKSCEWPLAIGGYAAVVDHQRRIGLAGWCLGAGGTENVG